MLELVVLLEESGYACAPTALLGSAGAARHLRRRLGRAACRVAAQTRLGGGHRLVRRIRRRHQHALLRPPGSRRGHFRRRGALLAPASEVEFEPFDAIDATAPSHWSPTRPGSACRATSTGAATGSPSRSPRGRHRRARSRWRSTTRANASSSAGPSAPTRRWGTGAPGCCWPPEVRSRSPTTQPGPPTPSRSRCRWRPRWRLHGQRTRLAGPGLGAPGLRRHRVHLGARPAVLAQARPRRGPHARHAARPSRARCRPLGLGAGEPRSLTSHPPPAPRCSRRRRGRGAAGIGRETLHPHPLQLGEPLAYLGDRPDQPVGGERSM